MAAACLLESVRTPRLYDYALFRLSLVSLLGIVVDCAVVDGYGLLMSLNSGTAYHCVCANGGVCVLSLDLVCKDWRPMRHRFLQWAQEMGSAQLQCV